jgi:hypothetical protein
VTEGLAETIEMKQTDFHADNEVPLQSDTKYGTIDILLTPEQRKSVTLRRRLRGCEVSRDGSHWWKGGGPELEISHGWGVTSIRLESTEFLLMVVLTIEGETVVLM